MKKTLFTDLSVRGSMLMDLREITASEIMSTDLTTVSPDEKLSSAGIMMIKKNIGGLPVVRHDNELIGIITQRDIQLSRYSIIGNDAFHVRDLMSKNPISCHIDDKLPIIVSKMVENNIERIPIVGDSNKILGIIVNKDVINTISMFFEN
jgi:CBS domain-containing protein